MSLIESFNRWQADDGEPVLRTEWAVCHACHGNGTSTAYLGAYTQSDREEMGEEWYEFADDIRAGRYDRTCEECGGRTTVQVPASSNPPELIRQFEEYCRDAYESRAIERMERMMGA